MGYVENSTIEFITETVGVPCMHQVFYVKVNDVCHKVLPKTLSKFSGLSSEKEYAEAIEYFAFLVLIKKSILNDAYFSE